MEEILKYFTHLTQKQIQQLQMLDGLYHEWNAKINVISRKDIDSLYLHHVLHSLSIAKFIHFRPGTNVLDMGTGGGFPGIPLAILFPEANFKMIDRTAKKIRVANEVASAIGLHNVSIVQQSGEEEHGKFRLCGVALGDVAARPDAHREEEHCQRPVQLHAQRRDSAQGRRYTTGDKAL